MTGSNESNTPSVSKNPEVPSSRNHTPYPPNAFTAEFLRRIGERDEPVTAGEADVAGPWQLEEIPGAGWGLFRAGEDAARRFRPFAVFRRRSMALLAAAILPARGGTRRSGCSSIRSWPAMPWSVAASSPGTWLSSTRR